MDSTTDVNMLLSNAEKVFGLQASLARAAAAKVLEGLDDPLTKLDRTYPQRMRNESGRLSALGAIWDARASEARRGYLLLSADEVQDTEFMFTYRDLISTCRGAGRVIFARQIDSDLAAATSPPPGGPVRPEDASSPFVVPADYGNPGQKAPLGPSVGYTPGPGAPKDWGNPGSRP